MFITIEIDMWNCDTCMALNSSNDCYLLNIDNSCPCGICIVKAMCKEWCEAWFEWNNDRLLFTAQRSRG